MAAPLEFDLGERACEIALRATAAGGLVLVQTDITERRAYEENERAADQLVRKVLESCPANIIMSRVGDGEIIYRTPAATGLLGTAKRTHAHFASRAERADFVTALLPEGRVDAMGVTGIRADGTRFPCQVSARLIRYRGEDVIVSTTVDVSREVELRRKLADQREQIFQAEKMSALGELLAGVAHELNNPLSVVVGHALMLREEEIGDEALRRVGKISEAAERCTRIVKSFLAMARQQPAQFVPVDLAETAETALDALAGSAEGIGAELETEIAARRRRDRPLDQRHAGLAHRRQRGLDGAFQIDAARRVEQDFGLVAQPRGIHRRKVDAEIQRQPAERHALDPAALQVAVQPGRRRLVVLEEGRIAVDVGAEPLAHDHLGRRVQQIRVEGRALGPLHAMVRPEHLRAIGHVDGLEGRLAGMAGGEGGMPGRMPVLAEDHGPVFGHQRVDRRHHRIAIRNRERAARAEIVLDVDHDQGVGGGAHGQVSLNCPHG